MPRRRKAVADVQGHRTKSELRDRIAAEAEDNLLTALEWERYTSPPGGPPIPHLLGPGSELLDGVDVEPFMKVRRELISRGKACTGDTKLILAYVHAYQAGYFRFLHALETLIDERQTYDLPQEIRRPMPLPPHELSPGDDGVVCDKPDCKPLARKCAICKEVAAMVKADDAEDRRTYPARLAEWEKSFR